MSDQSEGSGSENYEVEGIVGHKDSKRSGRKYEIKWKGYKETTFEPRENLVPNAENLVTDYDKKHPIGRKSLRKEKTKPKRETKSRKSKRKKILESESDDEATDSNIENEKPNVKANQKKLSKRMKNNIGGSKYSKNRLSSSKKRMKVTKSSKVKKRGRSRISAVESSSDEEYDVDILLDHRDDAARRMYLVKWEGYPLSEATWEPSSNLSCKQLVRQYEHLKGKWKKTHKRPRSEDEKTPSKRVRKSNQGTESDHEEKEKIVKKQAEGVEKGKTSNNLSEEDKASAGTVSDPSTGKKNEKHEEGTTSDKPKVDAKREEGTESEKPKVDSKCEEGPESDKLKVDSKQDSNMDKSAGDGGVAVKVEADVGDETKEEPEDKEGDKSEEKSVENKKSGGEGEKTKKVD